MTAAAAALTHALTHSLAHSLTHFFTYSLHHSAIRAFTHLLFYSSIKSVFELVEAIRISTPPKNRYRIIARVSQAIRIKVNNELSNLENFLSSFCNQLSIGGRIIFISFHSLEDRLVKHSLKSLSNENKIKILTKKPIYPSEKEKLANSRSKSAKLRAAERIS